MSEVNRLSLAIVVVCVSAVGLPFVAVWLSPPAPCVDRVAEPGVACPRGAALVVESGVALCRCPANAGAR